MRVCAHTARLLRTLCDLSGISPQLCLFPGPGVQSSWFTTTSPPPASSCALSMRCGPLSWGPCTASSIALLHTSSRRFCWWMTSALKVKPALDPPETLKLDGRRATVVGGQRAIGWSSSICKCQIIVSCGTTETNLSADHILLTEAGHVA